MTLYYLTGEEIKRGDIVLYLSKNDERYAFESPVMKVWDVVKTNAGKVIGVALMHPNADNPVIYPRVIHTNTDRQKEQAEQPIKFGDLEGAYTTTETLILRSDIFRLLGFLMRDEQLKETNEKNHAFIEQKIAQLIQDNNGLALFYQAKCIAYPQQDFDTYLQSLVQAAKSEFTPAICEFALEFLIGRIIEKDHQRSLGFYKEASELGDCIASYELANDYANGTGTTQDLAKSVEILELAAKQGSWRAKLALGSYYRFGWLSSFLAPHHQGYREINKEIISPEKAFFHYAHIVNQAPKTERTAVMNAQYHLGWMYQDGIGVEQDYKHAVDWYQKSSNLGNVIATNNLADKYEHGLGVEQDLDIAIELYSIAAEGNVVAAHLSLGRMYLQGRGVEKDLDLAQKHLKEVLSAGIDQIENMQQEAWLLLESFSEDTILKQAQRILAQPQNYTNEEIRKTANDIYKPFIKDGAKFRTLLYVEMAKRGDDAAQSQVGDWYLKGWGTEINYEQAYYWVSKAMGQDNWYAYYQMGYFYENGIIVEQNLEYAQELYEASLKDTQLFPKTINGKPNPEYEKFYSLSNKEALAGLERIQKLIRERTPKWMFWKRG